MKQVVIVTDSAASIPKELLDELGIFVVPVGIQMDGALYREQLDMSLEEFYHRFDGAQSLTTSQPSPGDFLEVYEKVAAAGAEIVSVHIAGRSSGTVQSAQLAAGETAVPVHVVDTESCSMGQGFLAMAAASWAQLGHSAVEIVQMLEEMRAETGVWVAVPTLKYLARSGKVGKMKAIMASILKIKPILGMIDGAAVVVDKARSYPRALERMVQLAEERFEQKPLHVAVLHTHAKAEAEKFAQLVEARLSCSTTIISEMGTALAVHGGQGMLGIAAYPVEKPTNLH